MRVRNPEKRKAERIKAAIGNHTVTVNPVLDVDKRVIALMTIYQSATQSLIDQYKEKEREYFSIRQEVRAAEQKARSSGVAPKFSTTPAIRRPEYEALSTKLRPFLAKWIEGVNRIRAIEPGFPYNRN